MEIEPMHPASFRLEEIVANGGDEDALRHCHACAACKAHVSFLRETYVSEQKEAEAFVRRLRLRAEGIHELETQFSRSGRWSLPSFLVPIFVIAVVALVWMARRPEKS